MRVNARRCTLGGAPSCTVRLRAFGVRPLHCLIQQSPGRTLARSMCPGNTLNGKPFQQERLHGGDILTLGPISFRVLLDNDALDAPADPRTETAEAPASVPVAPGNSGDRFSDAFLARLERLENQLAEWERRAETPRDDSAETVPPALLGNLMAELALQREELGRQRLEWAGARQRLDQTLGERMDRLAQLESQLTAQQENRRELEASFDRARVRLAELQESLEQSQQRLESEQYDFGQQRNAWESRRGELEAELADSRRQWADLVRQVELYQQQSQQDRDNWQAAEARLAEVRRCLEELSADLQRQRTDFLHESALLLDQKQSLETQLAAALQSAERERLEYAAAIEQWQRQCRELAARLESQQAVIAQQQQQLDELAALRQTILQKCDEQQATIEQLMSRCAQQETEAVRVLAEQADDKQEWDRQRAEFLQQQSQWECERARLLGELEAQQRQLDEQRATLQRVESASQDDCRQWEAERGRLLEQLREATAAQQNPALRGPFVDPIALLPCEPNVAPSCELPAADTAWPNEFDVTSSSTGTDSEAVGPFDPESFRDALEDTPSDVESTRSAIAQLQEMGVWRDTFSEPAESDGTASASQDEPGPAEVSGNADSEHLRSGNPLPAACETNRGSGDEDESIESYMNRLLHRLRGPSASSDIVYAPLPETPHLQDRSPVVEPNLCPASEPSREPPKEVTEFRPRSQAPEIAVDIAAMRALANDTARDAIATHKRESLYYQVFLNMLGALVAMAVCACFIHQFRHDSLLTNVCAMIALSAGGFGLTKYILYRRRGRNAANDSPNADACGPPQWPPQELSAAEQETTAEAAIAQTKDLFDARDTRS